MASKKLHCAFTDLSLSAAWRDTVYNCPAPWLAKPALADLRFFSRAFIGMDLLHVWYLGVGRDLRLVLCRICVKF